SKIAGYPTILGSTPTKDILDFLDDHPDEKFTNTELSKRLNIDYLTITQTLYKLKKSHRISNPYRGYWKIKPKVSKNDIINSEAYYNIKIHNVTLKPLVDFDPQGGSHKHVSFYLDEYSNFYIAPVPKKSSHFEGKNQDFPTRLDLHQLQQKPDNPVRILHGPHPTLDTLSAFLIQTPSRG
ncbi:MAG: hypothetical protein MUO40_11160, partial [Anaerolineaceae bacterium]|nr:hypothetical protein [Anaerolineaceae bacterium]